MLNIEKLGIDQRIRNQLLDASDGDKIIKSELYKLNVYGKGSFFKSHKDTPRGETMFGSLVVVFPTPHKGGALVLRHSDKEWTFDSGTLTLQDGTPSIAYIAFYSDVDHEVTVVESGYRVTLTYNLFFESEKEAMKVVSSAVPVAPDDHLLLDALSAALSDADFLPDGGYLGFGLSFKYPVSKSRTDREALVNVLKGTDALIYRVCQQASLDAFLKAVYNFKVWGSETQVMVPVTHILNPNVLYDSDHSGGIVGCVCKWHKGLVIHEVGQRKPSFRIGSWKGYYSEQTSVVQLAWVTPLTAYSNFSSTYTTYGNETSLECTYADLCIVAEVGPYGNRSTLGNAEKARIEQEKKKQSKKVRTQ
ncbi:hypothetical protein H0H93_003161 [Arthromyces matolae]|nr:hypothetical protein H0H93_003161 [Arthromyces matolae]